MSLRESQTFFYDLLSRTETITKMRQNRGRVLAKYFHSAKDREVLSKPPLERFQTYRDHVALGLLGGIQSAFPVIRSLVSEKEWNELLNTFYLKRLTRSPIARQVYHEFAHYLGKVYKGPLLKKFPYLQELAHYEALDLKIFYDEDKPADSVNTKKLDGITHPQELLGLIPVLNPHLSFRTYRWPVHMISKTYSSLKKVKPGTYSLLVYRDPESLEVKFIESNHLTGQLIRLLEIKRYNIQDLLSRFITKKNDKNSEALIREGIGMIRFLNEKGVILGFEKQGEP